MLPDLINKYQADIHEKRGHTQTVFALKSIIVEDKDYFNFTLMI